MTDEREALAAAIAPRLPELAEEVITAIRVEVAPYRRPLTGTFGANVRGGVELALRRFLAEFAGAPPRAPNRAVYVELGRGEFREGRPLDALLSAYRVGARLSWRWIVEVGRSAGVAPVVLYELGEAMFAYIDGLSAESTEGYAQAREAAAGGRALERGRLAALLLADPPAGEAAMGAAAASAGWRLPATVAVLVTGSMDVAARLAPGVLLAPGDPLEPGRDLKASNGGSVHHFPTADAAETVVLIVADPNGPGQRARLQAALGDADGALGPLVAPAEARRSARRALAAHRLQREHRLPAGLVDATAHLPDLLLHADEPLLAELAARTLAPLDGLPAATRAKLVATLRAWLDAQGRVEPTAAALGVHPQTVRYRLGQLREALGNALAEPEGRLALDLALRASARIDP